MKNNEKIDFDLNFLDKDFKEKPKTSPKTQNTTTPSSGGLSDSAKKWAWGIGIFLVIIIIGAFSDDSSTSSTSSTTTNNGMVQVGQYMCSSYYANRADELAPSSITKTSLTTQASDLDSMNTNLENEKSEVENEYVDETDQYSIDQHNEKVDTYNYHLQQYKNKYDSYDSSFNSYNTSVDTYNNFLKSNCTPN